VVLTQAAFDQSDWFPGAGLLAEQGYRALTYDVRGTCPGGLSGCSRGEFDQFKVWQDVLGALRFMRGQPGINDVVLMSAGFGAMAELQAAGKPGVSVDGLISIGAIEFGFGFNFTQDDIRRIGGSKLFIAAQLYEDAARSAQDFNSWARPPTQIKLVDSGEFGIDVLRSDQAAVVWGSVFGFLSRFPH
jgi:pimeloyl-ACP methyl ester carboxylesterase